MLSAFTARPIIELKQRDKSRIESVLAYDDRVLVGLNTGSLRIYRVNDPVPPSEPTPANSASTTQLDTEESASAAATSQHVEQTPKPPPASKPTDLLREVEKFSTRAVEQLARFKEANILVSLSNYAVSLHDLKTFEPIESPLPRTKNASAFAVTTNVVQDPVTGIPEMISRLAVSVKRRLLLWSWHESEMSPDVSEIVLAESIRSITWANATKLVCGMNSGYVIVDVESGSVEDVVGPGAIGGASGGQGRFGAVSAAGMGYMGLGGYMPKPLSAKLADGELLLAKDINTLFIDDSGKALEKRQVPWQAAPDAIGYSYPYILALQPPAKGCLEVRNPDTLSLLQTISLPGAASLHIPPPTVSLSHGKGFHVSSDRAVWKMEVIDYDSQVAELVKTGKLDEAISLLSMLEDALLKNKTETLREVKMQKAEVLFRQKKYLDSMDLFNEDDVNAPPERVLKLFPRTIAGDLSGVEDERQDDSEPESSNGRKASAEHDAKPDTAEVAASLPRAGGFAKYLMGSRKPNPETASIASSKKGADDDVATSKAKVQDELAQQEKEKEKDLMAAVLALNGYLAGARTRLQRVIDPATGKLKPRKSQSGSTEEAFKTLLLSSPDESDEQLERELQATYKTVDTSLFRAFMYSRPTLASSLFRIPNFCDPDVVNERLVEHNRFNELVDFFYGKKLHRQALDLLRRFGSPDEPDEAAPGLYGPQRTVMYLQGLPPEMIDVILEFSEWTLRKDPELGMEVFLADSENAETLPRDRVVAFLDGIDIGLEIRYLEHIITELNDMTPDFHNLLMELYIRQLLEKDNGEEWDALMARLVRFLMESKQIISLGRARNLIPRDDPRFYEAQAVVLSNMGQHRQALMIYVFKMQDYAKAEEYCNRIHKTQEPQAPTPGRMQLSSPAAEDKSTAQQQPAPEEKPSIYHTLLSLYLTPPPEHPPNLGPALDLLSKHGSRLPATSTLSLVPDTLPVAQLESYFRGRMRSANSAVNETRVVAGLRKAAFFASESRLFLGDGIPGAGGQQGGGRNRRVVIAEERVCGVCHKRLGGSVVAVFPDNAVVHYACMKNRAAGSARAMSPPPGEGARSVSGSVSVRSGGVGAWGRVGG
ncbi:hypothetical protein N658DRAFT_59040 [Parathielavia hyrcaniae]|uniref:CNH domain-containing protein n=1 Tax=Parathielavia hyrcaniae TaxID=113614 RepID=A0AAN6Q443_9PEZI|nr:hypothetical protein N658DRAFT_59040 [Parathielavia hyrcaniae]